MTNTDREIARLEHAIMALRLKQAHEGLRESIREFVAVISESLPADNAVDERLDAFVNERFPRNGSRPLTRR